MTEIYNCLFIFPRRLAPAKLKHVLAHDLAPVWEIFGAPSDLMSLNVGLGQEIHTKIAGDIEEQLLVCASGTVVSLRGDASSMGTVQYYTLGHFGAIAVARPFQSMRAERREDWLRQLWLRLRPGGAVLGVAGRELEMSAHEADSAVRDWRTLRNVRLVEYFVISELVAGEPPEGATIVSGGYLLRETVDRDGGSAVH